MPREECRDITEQVPVVVCTQIDKTREPKATLVSRPYGRSVFELSSPEGSAALL